MIRTAALAALLALSAWASAGAEPHAVGDLTIERPQLREMSAGAPVAGGYLLVTNAGEEADRLVAASTPGAGEVQIHEMSMEGDVMRMREVEGGLAIPPGESISLQPGGYHLMLMGPEALTEGEAHDVTLVFERAGEITVPFAVETLGTIRDGLASPGGMGADEMDTDGMGDDG